jgi:hypothetical protein
MKFRGGPAANSLLGRPIDRLWLTIGNYTISFSPPMKPPSRSAAFGARLMLWSLGIALLSAFLLAGRGVSGLGIEASFADVGRHLWLTLRPTLTIIGSICGMGFLTGLAAVTLPGRVTAHDAWSERPLTRFEATSTIRSGQFNKP